MEVPKEKVETKGIMEDDEAMAQQHLCLHTFLTWATHGAGDLSLLPRLPLGWKFRDLQNLDLQGRWEWKRQAKGSDHACSKTLCVDLK